MGISQFPAAAADGATEAAFASTIPDLQKPFEHDQVFEAGIYEISIAPDTTDAQVVFLDASSVLVTATTTSGTVTTQLNTAATKVFITTKAGGTADAIVTITKSAAILTPDDIGNGTMDTINTTGAYNETGLLSVLAFGGGDAGTKGGTPGGGSGGRAGGVALGFVYNNGATTITIGAKGVAATSNNTNKTDCTESSFGNLLTTSANHFFFSGNGGGADSAGVASLTFPSFNTTSTTGGGGGGGGYSNNSGNASNGSGVGAGSGLGTGGTGGVGLGGSASNANPNTKGTDGTGKASGGGGGATAGNLHVNAAGRFAGDGTDGVVYVLRGF
jgi:hypothetical protein